MTLLRYYITVSFPGSWFADFSDSFLIKMEQQISDELQDDANAVENRSKTILQEFHKFLQSGVHILQDDTNAMLQLALNLPDTSTIYEEAGMQPVPLLFDYYC